MQLGFATSSILEFFIAFEATLATTSLAAWAAALADSIAMQLVLAQSLKRIVGPASITEVTFAKGEASEVSRLLVAAWVGFEK
mmetsp:Transcript_19123/g.13858  ORF Transcript_19123/g.13858 Transcript_19123/m.13858 type:complete len:83 (+) Transcript_19123:473-721(+)